MYLECLKDSVKIPFASEFIDTFTDREKSEKGVVNQYTQDEADIINNTITNQIFKI